MVVNSLELSKLRIEVWLLFIVKVDDESDRQSKRRCSYLARLHWLLREWPETGCVKRKRQQTDFSARKVCLLPSGSLLSVAGY